MEKLKYLFSAEYKDGSFFDQTPEDVSKTNPEKSCFHDVKHDQLIRFGLTDGVNTYVLDLRDCHFELNGIPFKIEHEQHLKNIRLIYFRKVQRDIHTDFVVTDDIQIKELGTRAGETRIWY